MNHLNKEARAKIIALRDHSDKTFDEIAAIVGCSVSSVFYYCKYYKKNITPTRPKMFISRVKETKIVFKTTLFKR